MRLIDADALPIKFDGHTVSVWKNDLEAAPTINPYEWISVEDRLPEKDYIYVLVYKKSGETRVSFYYSEDDGCGYFEDDECYGSYEALSITHWMPLPTPPTVKEAIK